MEPRPALTARERKDPEKKSMWKNSVRSSSGEVNYSALVLNKGKISIAGKDRQAEVMLTKAEEMAIILKAGEASDPATTGGRWYVVESNFVYKWLAYVALKENAVEGVCERPRAIDNTVLLGVQETTKLFYLKEDKKCASDRHPGDYRLVNQQTWKKFCSLYPGSGPAVYVEDGNKEDCLHFYIDQAQSPYAKEREVTEENEFDEFTTGEPVFKRNRGPKGADFDFYRDSGLEDIFRASGEFIGGVISLFEAGDEVVGNGGGYAQMGEVQVSSTQEEKELEELLKESDEERKEVAGGGAEEGGDHIRDGDRLRVK
ncbi:hypothetical protein TrCOL_g7335 [Triparma columacea]|uniref:DUSP domain-containing protein n=1 Tax=Triparma columacea TaxID=722753 RepID=A0A9W7G0D9_9STRA|nr:hypothetical protein TrCOL_g7335 [Triparma columacea]